MPKEKTDFEEMIEDAEKELDIMDRKHTGLVFNITEFQGALGHDDEDCSDFSDALSDMEEGIEKAQKVLKRIKAKSKNP